MTRTIKYLPLLMLAPIIFGCSASVRDAAAPNSTEKPSGVVCENAKMQRVATSPRDCIEHGGMLL